MANFIFEMAKIWVFWGFQVAKISTKKLEKSNKILQMLHYILVGCQKHRMRQEIYFQFFNCEIWLNHLWNYQPVLHDKNLVAAFHPLVVVGSPTLKIRYLV
jgi:hypothetical protein